MIIFYIKSVNFKTLHEGRFHEQILFNGMLPGGS